MKQTRPLLLAPRLNPGDTVGVITPSFPALRRFPHRMAKAENTLKDHFGLSVVYGPHAMGDAGWVSASGEERAEDLNTMFAAPEVKAIIAALGGDHSVEMLPFINWDLIRAHPKIFVGYSDVTVLHLAIHRMTGLVTFQGPSFIGEFGEFPDLLPFTANAFEAAVMSDRPLGATPVSEEWTEDEADWSTGADATYERTMLLNPGSVWIRRGEAEGPLIGGCVESLQHLRGTPFWPDLKGAILLLETSEEAPSPAFVASILADYAVMGVLAGVSGLIVGRPRSYSFEDHALLLRVLEEATRPFAFPVLADIDFGHTAPMLTLPMGVRARLDGEGLSIVDPAVS